MGQSAQGGPEYQAIINTAVDGIVVIDEVGTVQSFNPAAKRIFGYEPAEVIGQNVKMLMPGLHRDQHDDYLTNYHRTGVAQIIGIGREVQGQRKDGSLISLDLDCGMDERRQALFHWHHARYHRTHQGAGGA